MYEIFASDVLNDLSHVSTILKTKALTIIADALYSSFNDYDVTRLIILQEEKDALQFSKHICLALEKQSNTPDKIWYAIKEVLKTIPISLIFINNLAKPKNDIYDIVIPMEIQIKSDFDKTLYSKLIDEYKKYTKIKTNYFLTESFKFVHRFIEKYDFYDGQFLKIFNEWDIIQYCNNDRTKLRNLKIFLNDVLQQDLPSCWFIKSMVRYFIVTDDVEIIYKFVKDKIYEELIFLLLLTTNIAIHALVRIKIKDVINAESYVVQTYNFVNKKNPSVLYFCSRIVKLIKLYLNQINTNDIYLFPINPKSMNYFVNRLILDTGLRQKKFKPYIFGCTYSRLLNRCGDSSDEVLTALQSLKYN